MNTDSVWTVYARAGYVLNVVWWLLVGGIAALWWLPSFMGALKPIPWTFGAVCLFLQWIWVFNPWPGVGTRRFFRESKFLKFEIALLIFISGLFAFGFAIAA